MAAGVTCSFTVNVTSSTPGAVVNTATVASTNGGPGTPATASLAVGATDAFQVSYFANLNAGESFINMTNTGTNGANLLGPGFGAAGNTCINVYAFSPDEQLIACCSCLITPNGLANLGVTRDITSSTLTSVVPNSVVIKLITTGAGVDFTATSCRNSAALAGTDTFPLAGGTRAFGTTLHAAPLGGSFAVTERPFLIGTLGNGELASLRGRCSAILGNGSGFGICKSCASGAFSAAGVQ
jgi:hypothetical protein